MSIYADWKLSPIAIAAGYNLNQFTITNYPTNGDTFTIPEINPEDIFMEDSEDDEDMEDDDDEDDWGISHAPNSSIHIYSEEALKAYQTILHPEVYAKYLLFFSTTAEITAYCAKGMNYKKAHILPHEAGVYSFYYSSDQLPYVAKISQPCWGQFGGVKPGQTNLYLWRMNKHGQNSQELMNPVHPYFNFFKDIRKGMFKDGTLDSVQIEFMQKYGEMFTPQVLEAYPSPVVAGYAILGRSGWSDAGTDLLEPALKKMVTKGMSAKNPYQINGCYGYTPKAGTWEEIRNQLGGTFNKSIMSLPSYAADPDYSCWNSPINNLWSELDIQEGGKFITGRATDMVWDPWVERNTDNGYEFYGRNDGSSRPSNDGEVGKDLKKYLNTKEPKTFEEAYELARSFMKEKVYGPSVQQQAA